MTGGHAAFAYGIGGVLLWLSTWQWFTSGGPLTDVAGIPKMSVSLRQSAEQVFDPTFWSAITDTVVMAMLGLSIAFAIGLVLGVATGLSGAARRTLDPTIQFLRPLPVVVLLPLALLVLGPTLNLGVFLAAFAAVWPILVQVQVGVRDVDPVALDTARSLNLSWRRTQTAIVLPSATPYILTGLRISASAALLVAIGAGLLGGAPGLGRRILIAQQASQADLAFALILWTGVLGLGVSTLLKGAERLLVRGRRPVGEGVA